MNLYEIRLVLGGTAMVFAVITSFLIRSKKDISVRVLQLLVISSFINEIVATTYAYKIGNSNIVYGFYSPIELFLISLYFNYSIDGFSRKRLGVIIGSVCLVIGYVNYFIIQSPKQLNNFYLLFESIVVVSFSLYSFYRMLLADDSLILTKYPHFWFTTILFFFWTSTLFLWGTYGYLTKNAGIANNILLNVLLFVNIIYYLGYGFVFLRYKKMKMNNG